ncbi:MAG: tandem-95 repeat protein [Pirellulales bacterium]
MNSRNAQVRKPKTRSLRGRAARHRLGFEQLESRRLLSTVKNVILMIGDGMGFEHVKAAHAYLGGNLVFENFPQQARMTTYSANSAVTDSAAAATAMATGRKVNNDVISMAYPGDGLELTTSLEHYSAVGKATGLVTTTYVTHATPAAFGAHDPSRNNTSAIAADFLGQTKPNVLLGGGGNGMSLSSAQAAGYTIVTNNSELTSLDANSTTYLSGQFGSTNLPYEPNLGDLPHLSQMTVKALDILDNDPDGFFLMVEGGLIDYAAQSNDIELAVNEVVEFNNAVNAAYTWATGHTDTLILVVADHEAGGLTVTQDNGATHLPTVSWSTTGHTGANVPVYAWGPNSSTVVGLLDNTNIFAITTQAMSAEPFSLATIPDTQTYVRDNTPQFTDQTQWIANSQAAEKIAMVSHLGDLVDTGSDTTQWGRANAAMTLLDASPLLPYSAPPGNHDFDTFNNQSSAANYLSYFGPTRYSGRSWYGGSSPDQTSHYQVFTAGGREFLHLGLEWSPRADAIIWAQGVINDHSDLPAILTTHEYLGTSGRTAVGSSVFNSLVRTNPQIFLVLSGHVSGENHQVSYNDAGLEVVELLGDYQSRTDGGGWMQLLRFYPDLDRISVETYSPTLNKFETDTNSQYAFAIDFERRFNFSALPQTVSFQQNVGGYTGTIDTQLLQNVPSTSYATATSLTIDTDEPPGSTRDAQALLSFSSIFGTSPGQIPSGAGISSARLELNITNTGSSFNLHRMLSDWAATDTWNSLTDGIAANGSEAMASVDASTGAVATTGLLGIDVTTSLRAWQSDLASNKGWAMLPTGADGVDFYSAEGTTPPRLVVVYTLANAAPVATDDSYGTDEDTTLTVSAPGVLANDSDVDGDSLAAVLVAGPSHGSLTINADGSFGYTPNANFNGADSFSYKANDGSTDSNVATVTLIVSAVNDAPVATDDSYGTTQDMLLSIAAPGVLANDNDGDGDSLTAVVEAGPTNGTLLTLNADGSFTYTPNDGFYGTDSFTYTIDDGMGTGTSTAVVTIAVTSVNDAPTFAKGADQTVLEDAGPQTINGWATGISAGPADESGQAIAFEVIGNSNPGLFASLAITLDGTLVYTPADNANGSATVSVVLRDDGGTANGGVDTSPSQEFTITVAAVNDTPTFVKGTDQTGLEDAGPQTITGWAIGVSAGPADEVGQTLNFQVSTDNSALFSVQPAVDATGSLTYTPAPDANGLANVTVMLKDDGGTANGGVDTSASQEFTITVTAVNDAPTFVKGADQTELEDAGPQTITGWAIGVSAGPADEVGQTLSFQVSTNNSALFSVQPAVDATGTLTYTPADNANGSATVTVVLRDGGGTANGGVDTSPSQEFTITVTAVNDAPVAMADSYGTSQDMLLSIAAPGVLANDIDVDGDSLTAVLEAGPTNGTLMLNADGSFTYTPNDGFSGTDSFSYRANDAALQSDAATVTITVQPATPVVVAADDFSSGGFTGGVGWLTPAWTVAGDAAIASSSAAPSAPYQVRLRRNTGYIERAVDLAGQSSIQLSFWSKVESFEGTERAEVRVSSDGVTWLSAMTFTAAHNSLPYSRYDIDLSSVSGFAPSSEVHIAFAAQMSDAKDYWYVDNVQVTGIGGSSNALPAAVADSFVVGEDTTLTVAAPGLLANDTDPDGDPLTTVLVSGPANGTLTLNSDGSFSYTPAADFSGTDSFTYRTSDGSASSNEAAVTITVTPVNDAPLAADDSYATSINTTLTIAAPGLLANDADPDGDPLTAVLVSGPANGTLTLNSDGSLSYTPVADFLGTDSFAYKASDGTADSSVATVTISVSDSAAPTTYSSTDVPKNISDPNRKGVPRATSSTLSIAPTDVVVGQLQLKVSITHADPAQLTATLTSPAGTVSTVLTFNSAGETVFDLSEFAGQGVAGTWTLTLWDHALGTVGTLDRWSLVVTPALGGAYQGTSSGESFGAMSAPSAASAPTPDGMMDAAAVDATLTETATTPSSDAVDALFGLEEFLFDPLDTEGDGAPIGFTRLDPYL